MGSNKVLAVYIRLSNEDSDVFKNDKAESNSIVNQRDLIQNFIAKNSEFDNYEIRQFCDDGYSGTNFERPAVKQLLNGVSNGSIKCIVVKDFSRFGRNYLEAGDYLEQIFPFMGVRFISINDSYDSLRNNGATAGIDIGLKNLINDMYSRDLSIKVKSGKLSKMQKGEYIASFAPFGYVKSKQKKNTLAVDEEAAKIVRRIFMLAMEGNNTTSIARLLNAENIPTPSAHYRKNFINKKFRYNKGIDIWYSNAVLKIIKDQTYLGKTINHRRESNVIGSKKTVKVSPGNWIIVENTHEPLVSDEIFVQAQKVIRKTSKTKKHEIDTERPLWKKVCCGNCKRYLFRKKAKRPYYKCNNSHFGENIACVSGKVYEEMILSVLLDTIRNQAKIADVADKLIEKTEMKTDKELLDLTRAIQRAEKQLIQLDSVLINEYDKYLDGQISRDVYYDIKMKTNVDIQSIKENVIVMKSDIEAGLLKKQEQKNKLVEHFKGKQDIEVLNRELVDTLVDAVYVYEDNRIEIAWKFLDDYNKLRELISLEDRTFKQESSYTAFHDTKC